MQTLPQNIVDNADFPHLQFVILDYNSTDGLEEWIKTSFASLIDVGRLVFYRTDTPIYFHRSNSRNITFNLASGEILCNIDADNFTGKGLAAFINEAFTADQNIFLAPLSEKALMNPDFLGRLCFSKSDFDKAGGYDESMEGYGFEDHDLVNRLTALGLKKKDIPERYLGAIKHDDFERICEEKTYKMLEAIYIRYLSPNESELMFFLKDGSLFFGNIINCTTLHSSNYRSLLQPEPIAYNYTLTENQWQYGMWYKSDSDLIISGSNAKKNALFKKISEHIIVNGCKKYSKVSDKELITNLVLFESEFRNRSKMQVNIANDVNIVNTKTEGRLFRNFNYEQPLSLKF